VRLCGNTNREWQDQHFDNMLAYIVVKKKKKNWICELYYLFDMIYLVYFHKNWVFPISLKCRWFFPIQEPQDTFKKCRKITDSFAIISLWRRAIPFSWTNLNPLHLRMITQGWFVPSLVKIGPIVLEKKIFKWPHPIFYIFDWLFTVLRPAQEFFTYI
jgi:hypothetical protein